MVASKARTLARAQIARSFSSGTIPTPLREELICALRDVFVGPIMPSVSPRRDRQAMEERKSLPSAFPRVLGVHGRLQTGKTVLAKYIARHYEGVVEHPFSHPIIAEVNWVLHDLGLKHRIDDVNKAAPHYRRLLQVWAQGRRAQEASYWLRDIHRRVLRDLDEGKRLIILSGLREPLEYALVRDLDGEVWKVTRPQIQDSDSAVELHPNETALDHLPPEAFSLHLVNDCRDLTEWEERIDEAIGAYAEKTSVTAAAIGQR